MKLMQMTLHVCACAVTAAALVGEAWASPESDAVRKFGLPGWWMVDCSKPASDSNPALAFAAPEVAPPFVMTKPHEGTDFMRGARIIAPDRLAYTNKSGTIAIELLKRDGRLVVDKITVKKTGEMLIKDGKSLKTGDRGHLYEHCQPQQ
jgi:hypothetical protein